MNRERGKIRVLIVDDSKFMRHLIRQLLEEDDILVVGEARDGQEAVSKAIRLKPDVITMDYNMPKMHGVDASEMILEKFEEKAPKIIILSAYSEEAIFETFQSLEKGAIAFIRKPSGELSLDIEKVKDELLKIIRAAVKARVITKKTSQVAHLQVSETNLKAQVIVIGASTGGPPVVEEIISSLPKNFSVPILIVQHMPVGFTKGFADYLNRNSELNVEEAYHGNELQAGNCLVAPSGKHMELDKKNGKVSVILRDGEKVSGYRPSIDVLMKSIANIYPKKCLGIILTGMGHDGQQGLASIINSGGYTIAQSPETAIIETMPLAVINDKNANEILRPGLIADRIKELI